MAQSECEVTAPHRPSRDWAAQEGGLVSGGGGHFCLQHAKASGGSAEEQALWVLGGGPKGEILPLPVQSGVCCCVAEADRAASGGPVGEKSPVRLVPPSTEADIHSRSAQQPQEEAPCTGRPRLGCAECGGDHIHIQLGYLLSFPGPFPQLLGGCLALPP